MKEKDSILCGAMVIYQYDFRTQDGKQLKFAKLLVNICGMPVLINSSRFVDSKLYNKVDVEVYYDGKNWKIK